MTRGRDRAKIVTALGTAILLQIMMLVAGVGAESLEPGRSIPEGIEMRILFLHHSTGEAIWNGGMKEWFEKYNSDHGAGIEIEARYFPKGSPYPWNNYPYDYWNIWVNHASDEPYMEEPTLEMLAARYDVIVWKHCFPVCQIGPDSGQPDVASEYKSIENYKLQYEALKTKMREFSETKFVVWTGAAQVEKLSPKTWIKNLLKWKFPDKAGPERARAFFDWVKNDWDNTGDNIFVWDFFELETEGGLYLKEDYARRATDSHPNADFSRRVAPLLCRRIVDVIAGRGDMASITGE